MPAKARVGQIGVKKAKKFSPKSYDALQRQLILAKTVQFFDLYQPIDGNYLNCSRAITFAPGEWSDYHTQADVEEFDIEAALNHIELFCSYFSPEYGFSYVMSAGDSCWFHGGSSTTSMDRDQTKRANAIRDLARPIGTPNPIQGRFHDIYELNLLSRKHIDRVVFGQPLPNWIASGDRGNFLKISDRNWVWIVPDHVRPKVREQFLGAGLLLVPV